MISLSRAKKGKLWIAFLILKISNDGNHKGKIIVKGRNPRRIIEKINSIESVGSVLIVNPKKTGKSYLYILKKQIILGE